MRRHGNIRAWGPSLSMTASSISRSMGALDISSHICSLCAGCIARTLIQITIDRSLSQDCNAISALKFGTSGMCRPSSWTAVCARRDRSGRNPRQLFAHGWSFIRGCVLVRDNTNLLPSRAVYRTTPFALRVVLCDRLGIRYNAGQIVRYLQAHTSCQSESALAGEGD